MTERDAFVEGLGLHHLNPPDIEAFVRGVPRRVRERLLELPAKITAEDRDEVGPVIRSLIDEIDRLVGRIQAAGYSLGSTSAEADDRADPFPSPPSNDDDTGSELPHPELFGEMERLETGAVEAARRLSGIPVPAWDSDPDLLGDIRAIVAAAAGRLRALADAVATARHRWDNRPEAAEPEPETS